MADSTRLPDEPEFFIAGRLRGIPLVTANDEWTTTRTANMKPNTTTKKPIISNKNNHRHRITVSVNGQKMPSKADPFQGSRELKQLMMEEVERRQVNQPISLLSTSISNSPKLVQSSKSARSTTTSTKRPTTSKRPPQTSATTKALPIPMPTTTTTSTTTRMPAMRSDTNSDKNALDDRSNLKNEAQQQHSSILITRQAPDYRSGRQGSGSRQGHTRLNDASPASAGKNWPFLFNRTDGSFSLFEIAVLLCNVAIIGTIISVIIFTWIRSIKKKRNQSSAGKRRDAESMFVISSATPSMGGSSLDGGQHPSAGNTPAPGSRVSSLISSSEQQIVAQKPRSVGGGPMTPVANMKPDSNQAATNNPNGKSGNSRPLSEASGLPSKAPPIDVKSVPTTDQPSLISEPPKAISTRLMGANGQQQQQAGSNKAMAIVQPTENSHSAGLSSSMDSPLTNNNDPSNRKLGHHEQVHSTPNLLKSSPSILADKTNSNKRPDHEHHPRANSTNDSLESIELPESLVQSIKRVEQMSKVVGEPEPSPNLLLGEPGVPFSQQTVVGTAHHKSSVPPANQHSSSTLAASSSKPKSNEKPRIETLRSDTKDLVVEAQIEKPQRQPSAELPAPKPPDDPKPTAKMKGPSKNNDQPKRPEDGQQTNEMKPKRNNKMEQKQDSKSKEDVSCSLIEPASNKTLTQIPQLDTTFGLLQDQARLPNHQVVVNKLDKRKAKLEIVDIRDESVTRNMVDSANDPSKRGAPVQEDQHANEHWISMDGIAVTQTATTTSPVPTAAAAALRAGGLNQVVAESQIMSPSEIIGHRFSVDYRAASGSASGAKSADVAMTQIKTNESLEEESSLTNIEAEVEQDNRLRNRKYFVYIVHDGHFSAKKECIARIELPSKRRITLADVRQLIANSPDISLSSLRRNRFKFVTETYRLLNEDEDGAVLHQVYPTQGVFLKINVTDQPDQLNYGPGVSRGRSRLSSTSNSLIGQPTRTGNYTSATAGSSAKRRPAQRASDQRAAAGTAGDSMLPAIQLNDRKATMMSERQGGGLRGRSSGPSANGRRAPRPGQLGPRSKSGLDANASHQRNLHMGMDNRSKALNGSKSTSSTALDKLDIPDELDPESSIALDGSQSNYASGASIADMSHDRVRIISLAKYCSRSSCGRLATLRCGLCNQGHYCTVQCRIRDWPTHKQRCRKPRWKGG